MNSSVQNPRVGRLRAVREAQGRSLRAVAREAGLDPGQLSRIERGEQRASVDQLISIGRVLGLRDLTRLDLFREWSA
jgi:transcriptional regulator with XRE-family HTH domain